MEEESLALYDENKSVSLSFLPLRAWRAMYVEGFVFGGLSLSFFSLLFLGSSSCPRYHACTFPLGEQFMYILVLEGSENGASCELQICRNNGAVEEESFV